MVPMDKGNTIVKEDDNGIGSNFRPLFGAKEQPCGEGPRSRRACSVSEGFDVLNFTGKSFSLRLAGNLLTQLSGLYQLEMGSS